MERAIHCLLNHVRARHGLPLLRHDKTLHGRAHAHSRDMARRHYFAHSSLPGAIHAYLRGASAWGYGENIGWGRGWLGTPRNLVRSWMHSPGHRANILTRAFRDLGVGVAIGTPVSSSPSFARRSAIGTTIFGYRR